MKRITLLLASLTILLMADSCHKRVWDNPWDGYTDNNHRASFTATLDNYWATGESGLMIFLSDMSGNLLAEKSLAGTNDVILRPSSGSYFPEKIIETLVYKGPPVDGVTPVYFYSYLNIAPSDWIWKTFQADSAGTAYLQFDQIPQQTSFSISDYSQWIHGDVMSDNYTITLGKDPDNLYILMNTTDHGYMYKWVSEVFGYYYNNIDFAVMDQPQTKTIVIPEATSYSWRLSGYLPAGEHSKGMYTLDFNDRNGISANSVMVHYPSSIFSDYEFYIYTNNTAEPNKQWYQYDFGAIPDRIDALTGDIQVKNASPSHFSVNVSGTFDRLGSSWSFTPAGVYRYSWNVYGSPTDTSFAIPVVPVDLLSQLPGFTKDSLKLSSVEIKDFDGISSYDDLIGKMFVAGNYIANIVPKYSGLIYQVTGKKEVRSEK